MEYNIDYREIGQRVEVAYTDNPNCLEFVGRKGIIVNHKHGFYHVRFDSGQVIGFTGRELKVVTIDRDRIAFNPDCKVI